MDKVWINRTTPDHFQDMLNGEWRTETSFLSKAQPRIQAKQTVIR